MPGYPPQPWGQPYPGPYGAYPPAYPAGPYAQPQPAQQAPQHYTNPGRPTVPVMPVQVDDDLVPPAAPPHDRQPRDLPADAAQAVPKVVATTNTTLDASTKAAKDTIAATPSAPPIETAAPSSAPLPSAEPTANGAVADSASGTASAGEGMPSLKIPRADDLDEWASENDW